MPTIGIHTKTISDEEKDIGLSHAWVSLEENGVKRDFSSYPNNNAFNEHRHLPPGEQAKTMVIEGLDKETVATTSLYKEISQTEAEKFKEKVAEPRDYQTRKDNCAHFSRDVWEHTTGIRLEVTHEIGERPLSREVDTPVGLQSSIRARELDKMAERREETPAHDVKRSQNTNDKPRGLSTDNAAVEAMKAQLQRERDERLEQQRAFQNQKGRSGRGE